MHFESTPYSGCAVFGATLGTHAPTSINPARVASIQALVRTPKRKRTSPSQELDAGLGNSNAL